MASPSKRRKTKKRNRLTNKPRDISLRQSTVSSKDEAGARNSSAPGRKRTAMSEAMIDETIAQSFPASDPPSWTTGREKNVEPSETEGDDLMGLSMEELNKKASELDIPGRHSMNKEQLILAIRGRLSGTEG
jgi:hypothetical protein